MFLTAYAKWPKVKKRNKYFEWLFDLVICFDLISYLDHISFLRCHCQLLHLEFRVHFSIFFVLILFLFLFLVSRQFIHVSIGGDLEFHPLMGMMISCQSAIADTTSAPCYAFEIKFYHFCCFLLSHIQPSSNN